MVFTFQKLRKTPLAQVECVSRDLEPNFSKTLTVIERRGSVLVPLAFHCELWLGVQVAEGRQGKQCLLPASYLAVLRPQEVL